MPQFAFTWTHPDLPKALKDGYAATAPGASKAHVESRIEAAKASGGVAFTGTIGAKDRETARAFLIAQAHARYQSYATNLEPNGTENPAYTNRVAINPEEMTLSLKEVG